MSQFEVLCWLAIAVCSVIVIVGVARGILKWSARQVIDEVKQQPQGDTNLASDTSKSICPCCERVVVTETMQRLKSNQLVCQKCYQNFCGPKQKGDEKAKETVQSAPPLHSSTIRGVLILLLVIAALAGLFGLMVLYAI